MSEKNLEIKREDKKAFKKFVVILILAGIFGGIIGGTSSFVAFEMREGGILETLSGLVGTAIPYSLFVVTTVGLIYTVCMYRSCRKLFDAWDQEDEAIYDVIEYKLSLALWVTSLTMIIDYFLFAVNVAYLFVPKMNGSTTIFFSRSLMALAGLIYCLVFTVKAQQKLINFEKEINPEKSGSVYDMKFQEKWVESCDEAEKQQIYESAYSAYKVTNMTCMVLWLVCVILMTVSDMGLMPVTLVSIIWAVQTSAYCLKAIKLTKGKIR